MFTVEKTQINPFVKLGVLKCETYEKAFRIAERWINDMKDSWNGRKYVGPDYFYTIREV